MRTNRVCFYTMYLLPPVVHSSKSLLPISYVPFYHRAVSIRAVTVQISIGFIRFFSLYMQSVRVRACILHIHDIHALRLLCNIVAVVQPLVVSL